MKIITFDHSATVATKTGNHKMFLEETAFCCPSCSKTSKAKFSDMIFRTMEFYCGHCGNFYKITNPAFTAT